MPPTPDQTPCSGVVEGGAISFVDEVIVLKMNLTILLEVTSW